MPAFSSGTGARPSATARRMALFIAIEAGLALILLGLATAMTMATPALHNDPVWPWNVRLSFDAWSEVQVLRRLVQMPVAYVLAVAGLDDPDRRLSRAPSTRLCVRVAFRPGCGRARDRLSAIDRAGLSDHVRAFARSLRGRLDRRGRRALPGALRVLSRDAEVRRRRARGNRCRFARHRGRVAILGRLVLAHIARSSRARDASVREPTLRTRNGGA